MQHAVESLGVADRTSVERRTRDDGDEADTNINKEGEQQEDRIDNSELTYIPVKLQCGILVMCRPDVLSLCLEIVEHLNTDLGQCLEIVPTSVRPLVRRTRIWVNRSYWYGPHDRPENVNHTTTHHHESWLLSVARDRPEKALSIEIYNCFDYVRMRHHWNGCGLILHEVCHLIHQQVLGLEYAAVKAAYERAKKSGKYEHVLRRDWAGKVNDDTDMAYAMVDHKEFFAEMSVTYWSNGYRELDMADRTNMAECSPPITEPTVLARLGRDAKNEIINADNTSKRVGFAGLIEPFNKAMAFTLGHHRWKTTHCNKFYPFTRGQLQFYDPVCFADLEKLWYAISLWEDPRSHCACFSVCWPNPPWSTKEKFNAVFESYDADTATISDTVDL